MKKILILEDDYSLAKTLAQSLKSSAWQTAQVHTIDDFYRYLKTHRVEICVLDRIIGDQDSLSVIDDIRDLQPQAKILFLTHKNAVMDRVDGLEHGADDYLAKPFSMAELKLRIKSLAKLYKIANESIGLTFGSLKLYPEEGLFMIGRHRFSLQKRETEIITCLITASGRVVSRSFIKHSLWPENKQPDASTLDVYIRRLRQKLGKFSAILKTKRGFGYYLVAPEREI